MNHFTEINMKNGTKTQHLFLPKRKTVLTTKRVKNNSTI